MAIQIVVDEKRGSLCAGLPPCVRAFHRAAGELSGSRVVLEQGSRLPLNYPFQTAQARVDERPLDTDSPLLALNGDGFADEGALARLVAGGLAVSGVFEGRVVAAYLPKAGALASLAPAEAARRALASKLETVPLTWTSARGSIEARAAERALCAGLVKDTDGYIARVDRLLSIALSRLMLPLPVTPNAITTAGLMLSLLGCWWLATGENGRQLAGAALLWFSCILDGCDGEVARLKLLCSPSGAAYDLWADHLAHLATFVAIPVAVHRARPELEFLRPGILLLTGFLGCVLSVWWLVLRLPDDQRGPYATLIERVASRDYVYLIVVLVLLGKLEWFLWAASVGSHAFYLALWAVSLQSKATAAKPAKLPTA